MELRHLRYFVCVAEEQHYGRAADRLRIAQPALSRQIQDLEKEIGFQLFERLPRGVRLNAAGQLFLDDARRILQDVQVAGLRAGRVASGQAGMLRLGFIESISWKGVVPESVRQFRRKQPAAELELYPMHSLQMIESVRSGKLDGGFVFSLDEPAGDLEHRLVARQKLVLAAPQHHPITRLKRLRLRDLSDAPFIWIQRVTHPVFHDRLLRACIRGGLKSPHIVQYAVDSATALSLVSCRLGVALVPESTRWHQPPDVVLRPIVDLNFPIPFYFIWKKDNESPLLRNFLTQVSAA